MTYTQGQLHVEANNSSLVEILNQISRETGVSIEGANHDQRLYGQYGPGPVVSVLPELLDGAGYDYVVEGGSNGKPGKLVLTPSTGGGTSSGSNPVTSNLSPTPAPQPAMGNANGSGMEDPTQPPNPKTPQQIFEELRRMHPQ